MMIGFWDLYKNVPILSDLIHKYLNSVYEFFEANVGIRMSMLLGLIISKSTTFLEFFNYMLQPGVFGVIVKCVEPVCTIAMMVVRELQVYLYFISGVVRIPVILIREVITPVLYFAFEIVKLKWSFVKLLLYLPTISLVKLSLLAKDTLLCFLFLFKQLLSGFSLLKRVIIPAAQSTYENKEATVTFIQFFQQIGFAWS